MMGLLSKKTGRLASFLRVVYYRLAGISVPFNATIKGGTEISGDVVIGEKAHLDDGVRINGKVRIGRGSFIQRGVQMSGNIEIGDNTVVGCYTTLSTMPEGLLKIGSDVLVNRFSVLGSSERVEIKDHCIFASHVEITDAFHGFEDPSILIKHAKFSTSPITIEENVWLGSGVVVLKGVNIGAGAVRGAKALVNSNIPPLAIAYGIPASVKRYRGEGKTGLKDGRGKYGA